MSNRRILSLALACGLCLLTLAAFLLATGKPARAQVSAHYVAPGGDCGGASPCYGIIQDAVDAASDGDVIKVATGIYTGTQGRPSPPDYVGPAVITQAVYISKTIKLQGGYTAPSFSDPPNPEAHPTMLDAEGQGRVLFVAGTISPTIEGLQITGGDADGLGGEYSGDDAGGGVYVDEAAATISNCQVFSNTALLRGGGIYLQYNKGTVRRNIVHNNTASSGGGVCFFHSDASLSENVVMRNEAKYGGGLSLYGSTAIVSGNTIVDNRATTGGGGGVFVSIGIWNVSVEDPAILVNNVIADNGSSADGSGLFIFSAEARLVHNTIVRNKGGYGIGIYLNPMPPPAPLSRVVMTDTILAGHRVGIKVEHQCSADMEATLWGTGTLANETDWDVGYKSTLLTGTVNIWGEPAFVDPDAGDYHVGLSSAAIDAGVNMNVDQDIDGDPRPQGYGYDIGADETGVVLHKQALFPVQAGGWLTYGLHVTNTSDVDVHATITDLLPAQTTTQPVVWTPVITSPGGTWQKTFSVGVAEDVSGPLTNVLQVVTVEGAGGIYTHTLVPDLDVAKQASSGRVQAGERVTYTLYVTNTGDFYLHATVTDILPAHVTTTHPLVWTPLITAPGGVWKETLVVTVEKGCGGLMTNTLQVTTSEGARGIANASVRARYDIYLPLVLRQ